MTEDLRRRDQDLWASGKPWQVPVETSICSSDMIYAGLDNFYISKDELALDNPSRRDGISEEVETELRNFGTTLIQEGGCLLDLPEVVPATGQVLFHRFFCKESMAKFDVEVGNAKHCLSWIQA